MTMGEANNSCSLEQRGAQAVMLQDVSRHLGIELEPNKEIRLAECRLELDGFAESDECVTMVECYARIGRLRGSQPDKIDSDVLKLWFCASQQVKPVRCVIVFADDDAKESYQKGWRRQALQRANIEVYVAQLSDTTRHTIQEAQRRQHMTNTRAEER